MLSCLARGFLVAVQTWTGGGSTWGGEKGGKNWPADARASVLSCWKPPLAAISVIGRRLNDEGNMTFCETWQSGSGREGGSKSS
jgi:hypothetical protein